MLERCPRCGVTATYVGVRVVECPTSGCPNHRTTEAAVGVEDTDEDELAALLYEHAQSGFGFF